MTIEALTGSRAWLAAGWTMLHFLWVGGVLGLVAALGGLILRKAAPEVRYVFALACLAAMAAAPAWIVFGLVDVHDAEAVADAIPLPRPTATMADPGAPSPSPGPATDVPVLVDRAVVRASDGRWLEATAEGLPWLWIVGAPSTFAAMALGVVGAERLRRRGQPLIEGEPVIMVRRLADAMGIVRPVALAACDRLAAPILVGIVRPLILMPTAALTGWGPEQLEMALIHELAHVRRLDNLVNLIQRVVESLLFFHPSVWWVSAWARREREHCCDRMVVARTGRARPYAELLAELALQPGRPGLAASAMAGNPIVDRIRRILNPEDDLMPISRPVAVLAVALLVAPAVLIAAQAAKPPEKPKPENARVEELIRRTRRGAELFMGVQERVYVMIQIAGIQAQGGDREAARRTFQQAEELGSTVSFDDATYSPHILFWIIQAEKRLGLNDEAKATTRHLLRLAEAPCRRENQKLNLYDNLIRELVELGDKEGVQQTLQAGREYYKNRMDPGFEVFAPIHLIRLQAYSGDLAGALRMLHDPDLFKGQPPEQEANFRRSALFGVLMATRANNREGAAAVMDEAMQSAQDRDDPLPWARLSMRNGDLQAIAEARAGLGQFDEALKTARMIDAETIPGHLAEERKPEFLDDQRFRKVQALAAIGRVQAKAGDLAGARRTAEEAARIGRSILMEAKKYPVHQTAEVLAMAGDLEGALRLAEALDPNQRVAVYESIATVRRQRGDADGARKALRAAMELTRERLKDVNAGLLEPDSALGKQAYQRLEDLGRLQAKLGDRQAAIATMQRINSVDRELEALKHLARDMAMAGDLEGALGVVDKMNSPDAQAEALEMVAASFAHREPSR